MKFGVHVSIEGKIYKALDRAETLYCETMQIFTTNPRQWKNFSYSKKDINTFKKKREKSKIDPLFCHTVYLVNLASPEEKTYQSSLHSLIDSLDLARKLKAFGVVTHLGSHLGAGIKEGIARISAALDYAFYSTSYEIPIILENSSGGGSKIGGSLEEIAEIIKGVGRKEKILFCLDTAHVFEYGYNIKKLDQFLVELEKIIGLSKLCLLHLNDSKTPKGSRHDIHENIGKGYIGLETFRKIVNHPKLKHLPAILETPGFKDRKADRKNLDKLKELVLKIPS